MTKRDLNYRAPPQVASISSGATTPALTASDKGAKLWSSTAGELTWDGTNWLATSLATNIAGGAAGSLPYQTAAATTGMLAIGTDGRVLQSTGSAPSWVELQMTDIPSASYKKSVVVATTANLTLSAEQTIDGVLTSASRILVKDQTTTQNNGIYVTGAGAWVRSTDADTTAEIASAIVNVERGTVNGGKIFSNVFLSTDTLGTTTMPWYKVTTEQDLVTSGSTTIGAVRYSGTTNTSGQFNGGTTTPTGTTRLNYGGYIYPTFINLVGSGDTVTAATHYFVEIGTDGFVRPKTLANVRTEIVTTAAVNSAALTTTGTVTSGTWSGLFGAVSGANLTTLNASNLSSGTVPDARLSTTGVSANTYGSSTQVPVFTVDDKGRISSVTNTTIVSGVTNALKSLTTSVDVSASTAPTVGQVLTATSGTAATWQTAGGGGGGTAYSETPAGTINGSNVVFTLTNTPAVAAGVLVVLDGIVQYSGVDYTVSGSTITFVAAPATGSSIFAYYGSASGITNALKSLTTSVDVSASAAPTSGQVLQATSGTAATWQTLATGGVTNVTGTAPIASSGGATPAISLNDGGVTLAKMANLLQDQFIGRVSASTGVPETATITAAARTVIDDATVAAMVNTLGGAATTGTGGIARENSPIFIAPALGTPASGNASAMTVDGTNAVGFRNIPQNSQSTAYTCVLADNGKHIFHPSADTTARTFTIPANGSVDYPIGTAITFINQNGAGVVTIAITTDTMRLSPAGTTGSRTLAANGSATCVKVTSTEWLISGSGLT